MKASREVFAIQAVLFDCDGTLIDSEDLGNEVLFELVREHDIPLRLGEIRSGFLRQLLRRHAETRSKGQTRTLNKLRTFNRHIWRAWVLKDEFDAIFDYVYPGSAAK